MFRTTRHVKFELIDISLGILQISPVDCFLWIKLIIMIYYNTRRGQINFYDIYYIIVKRLWHKPLIPSPNKFIARAHISSTRNGRGICVFK
nr:MAG TPA: hypothetical protein [Caudoviricetes sp.]